MKKFKIKKAKNGLILIDQEGERVVFQDDDNDSIDNFADFLRYLCDEYSPMTSRYSPKRIHVIVKPGDKYADFIEQVPPPVEPAKAGERRYYQCLRCFGLIGALPEQIKEMNDDCPLCRHNKPNFKLLCKNPEGLAVLT